ncbi:head morphogenesis protein [Stagnimonas aquatica]|uniref:Head morphogenesis protein n=1 Tax=Stagnimonas aquatica TaxID=2689987 RepID=A0A3N0V7D6_9GAMM|nr:phage minor head protein [Stagnimonas aquatica]ROH88629.1 head morphogenesis protein [Stagnimonas aquatica]
MTPPVPIPKEAVAYFAAKKLKIGFDHRDVWNEEHQTSFTVAKVTELDVLADVQTSLLSTLQEGFTFDQWRARLRPELEKKGWWGSREVVDPETGEIAQTDLSSPGRLRTIYQTNLRTAYSAGQWERIRRTKRVLPYLLRTVGPSIHHREEHLAWHGTLLPADDPWWVSHPCPGGYGCRCNNRQVGQREYEKLVKNGVPSPGVQELDAKTGLPTGRLIRRPIPAQTTPPKDVLIEWKNRRTGKTELIPKGITPGFAVAPGAAARKASLARVLTDKLDSVAEPLAKSIISRWAQGDTLRAWLDKPEGTMPIAVLKDAQAEAIGATTHVVQISAETMAKQVGRHPELTTADYLSIPRVVDLGRSVRDTDRSMLFVLDEEPGYVAVVKSTMTGAGLFLTSYRRLSRDAAKRVRTLRQLLKE